MFVSETIFLIEHHVFQRVYFVLFLRSREIVLYLQSNSDFSIKKYTVKGVCMYVSYVMCNQESAECKTR